MSHPTPGLPARPSLEQLRKRAKELVRLVRAGDPAAVARIRAVVARVGASPTLPEISLADAQFVIAREHGFESWPKLVHHIETTRPAAPLARFDRLAADLVAADAGDLDALGRLNAEFGDDADLERMRATVRARLASSRGAPAEPAALAAHTTSQLAIDDARLFVARMHGFESWTDLATSSTTSRADPRTSPHGISTSPPFYRIDWEGRTIEPQGPLSDADWDVIFDVVAELGLTGIKANRQMTDAALARLPRLPQVTRLELGDCRRVTDEGLGHLAGMPQLRELDLSGWHSAITDRGLEVLQHLRELHRFQMCWPQRVTDAGVAQLRFCDQLESVDLLGTRTGDGAIAALAGKAHLRSVKAGTDVTRAGLPLLHEIPAFKTWHGGELAYGLMAFEAGPTYLLLSPVSFADGGLERLVGLDGLFALNIDGPVQVTGAALAPLTRLPNLGFLGVDPTDDATPHIAAMPGLRQLMCQDTKMSDDGWAAIGRSRSIEYIWGRRCYGLANRGFSALAHMPTLRGLSVSCRNVDDSALALLPSFPALREYMPMDVPDEGFRHIGECERLDALWCMYCRDTGDVATDHIAGLGLRTYYAGLTQITDRSLEVLSRMTTLEHVRLHMVQGVTNAGVARLATLPRLREVGLEGLPRVTRGVTAAFPEHVRVDYWT